MFGSTIAVFFDSMSGFWVLDGSLLLDEIILDVDTSVDFTDQKIVAVALCFDFIRRSGLSLLSYKPLGKDGMVCVCSN